MTVPFSRAIDAGTPPRSTGPSPVSVLVVDDDPSKRLALRSVLVPLGYRIVEAESGMAALRCLMVEDFAVILLDVCMPVMDGFATAGLMRQRKQSEMTPIIFITAFADDRHPSTDHYVEGAVDYIYSPVHPHELRAKVAVFANLFIEADRLAARAREVQNSADQLRLLTEASPIGIFQTDADNRYVYTNPRWSEISGVPADEALGKEWGDIVNPEHREVSSVGADGRGGRSRISHRFAISSPDGSVRWVLATSQLIADPDGATVGWVGTLADVTAEATAAAAMSEARDRADEASQLKSDFLANMSHEIRTPMNGVIGMTELLLETELDDRQRDFAETLRHSGEALMIVIDDILDFSKVDAGKIDVQHVPCCVSTITEEVIDLLASSANAKGLDLIAVIDKSVPTQVRSDPGRIRQIVINLVGNAIKFTQAGEVVVRVSHARIGTDDALVHFEITDTGNGIEADKLDSIFEPFVQADTSTIRRYGGTGLGLAISSQLVTLLGGDCGVVSRLGQGSSFWFTIRVPLDPSSVDPDPPDDSLIGLTALIVDDNATHRAVLTSYLEDWGTKVSTAATGSAALSSLRAVAANARPLDVVLLDPSMPETDGPDLAERILSELTPDTRLVLMLPAHPAPGSATITTREPLTTVSLPIHQADLRAILRTLARSRGPHLIMRTAARGGKGSEGTEGLRRLLLAEDNLTNQEVAVAMLSTAGYRVDTVLNGAEAVRAASTTAYDAILMDCQMPELNGYQATAAIRAQEGPRRRTPIIAVTAGARPEDKERCLAEGMDSYLAKPYGKDALLSMVAAFMGARPANATVVP